MESHQVKEAVYQALCNTRDILSRPRHHEATRPAKVGMFVTELRRINVHFFPKLSDRHGKWLHRSNNWRDLAVPGLKPWGITHEEWSELCYWIREAKVMFDKDKETTLRSKLDELRYEKRRALSLQATMAQKAQRAEELTLKLFEALKDLDKEDGDE